MLQLAAFFDRLAVDVDTCTQRLELVLEEISNAESAIHLRLDAARNRLFWVELILQTALSVCTIGQLIKDVITMNLVTPFIVSDITPFWVVSGVLVFGAILTSVTFVMLLRRYV